MDTPTNEPRLSTGDRRRNASHLKESVPGAIAYVASITLVATIVGDDATVTDRLVSLLPLLPSLWVVWAMVRMVRRSDEMTRMLHYQSMAAGFGVTMIAAMGTGLLAIPGDTGLFGRLTPWLIFALGTMGWAAAAGILTARRL